MSGEYVEPCARCEEDRLEALRMSEQSLRDAYGMVPMAEWQAMLAAHEALVAS